MSYASDYDDFEQSTQGEEFAEVNQKKLISPSTAESSEGLDSGEMSCSELANARWRFKQGWHKK